MRTPVWSLTKIDVVDHASCFTSGVEPSLLDIPFVRVLKAMNEIAIYRFMDSWWKI
jgi:hypothetical protein